MPAANCFWTRFFLATVRIAESVNWNMCKLPSSLPIQMVLFLASWNVSCWDNNVSLPCCCWSKWWWWWWNCTLDFLSSTLLWLPSSSSELSKSIIDSCWCESMTAVFSGGFLVVTPLFTSLINLSWPSSAPESSSTWKSNASGCCWSVVDAIVAAAIVFLAA